MLEVADSLLHGTSDVGIASWGLRCSRSLIHWTSDVAPSSLGMVRGIDHGIVSWGAQLFVFKSTSRGPLFGDLAHAGFASWDLMSPFSKSECATVVESGLRLSDVCGGLRSDDAKLRFLADS